MGRQTPVGAAAALGHVRGKPTALASSREQAGIVAKYERWWRECLRFLSESGLVRLEDGRVAAPLLAEDPEATWRAWAAHKAFLNDPTLACM